MPRCIIDNCTSVYDGIKERRRLFFNAPKDQNALTLWQKVITRQNFVVKPHHVVCEKHFRKEDILWRREIKDQNGVVIGVSPYKLPRLRKGVIPSLYLGNHSKYEEPPLQRSESTLISENLSLKENERPNSRNSNSDNVTIIVKPDILYSDNPEETTKSQQQNPQLSPRIVCDNVMVLTPDIATVSSESGPPDVTLEDLARNDAIKIPSSWIKYSISNDNESVLVFNENIFRTTENGLKTVIMKEIIIDERLCVHVNVLNERIDVSELRCANKISSIADLQNIVNLVYKLDICKGYCTPKNIDYTAVYVDPLNTYRHIKCTMLVVNGSRCKFCYE